MVNTFYYGNIFSSKGIQDGSILETILGFKDGDEIELKEVNIKLKQLEHQIKDRLGLSFTTAIIKYPDGNCYLDFFLNEFEETKRHFSVEIKIPEKLSLLFEDYEQYIFDAINKGKNIKADNSEGHFVSDDQMAKKMEGEFIQQVPKNKTLLTRIIQNSNNEKERSNASYLLHWSDNKNEVKEVLLTLLKNDPSHMVHNSATRGLNGIFPKVNFSKDEALIIANLLFHNSTACINKGLWLLSQIAENQNLSKLLDVKYINRIEALSQVKQPNLNSFTKLIVEKLQ